jgi:hypothetical protein
MRATLATLFLLATLASPAAALAASAEVKFIDPQNYTDARDANRRRDDVLRSLESHIKQLAAKHLPQAQKLTLEVLDVDLAGDAWPRVRFSEVRVLRGSVDWPRIDLRFTLTEGERVIASGTERVADMAYQLHGVPGLGDGDLPYEHRMLERWFRERFEGKP